jgi:hypothetical protein
VLQELKRITKHLTLASICALRQFQHRAYAAQTRGGELPPEFGWRAPEFPSEGIGKMGVAGETKFKCKHCQVRSTVRQVLKRKA